MSCAICTNPVIAGATKCISCDRPCHANCVDVWVESANSNCPACGNVLRSASASSSAISSSSFANRSFTFHVQNTNGDPRWISINPNNNISALKEEVRRAFGLLSLAVIRLVYDGGQLLEKQRIGDCLRNNATINMTANAQGASVASLQRLMREYQKITDNNPANISIQKPKGNLFEWKGVMVGPSNSAWAGGVFPFKITFTTNYPSVAPEVHFEKEKMFHPNVWESGKVCISTLDGDYDPSFSIISILTAIQSMLPFPNLKSVANQKAGNMFANDIVSYHREVRRLVENSA